MKRNAKKILIASTIAAAGMSALAAASYKLADRLVSVALDREPPRASGKSKRRLTGSDSSHEISSLLKSKGERLKHGSFRHVEITASDGERLVGHLYTQENAKRLIIAMHGWRSSWSHDFGVISEFWEKNDCNILYAEQRGQNGSGGSYMGFGMMERFDCLSWIKSANAHMEERLPVYLAGVSMGASTVLMASGLKLDQNVAGIMADCGFTSADAIWRHVAKNNLRISYGIMGRIANDMCRKRINMSADECSTIDALKRNRVPVLFIHGSDDRFVPVEMTYENYKACAAPKRLLIVPGAGHAMSYMVDKATYEKEVIDFWRFCEG